MDSTILKYIIGAVVSFIGLLLGTIKLKNKQIAKLKTSAMATKFFDELQPLDKELAQAEAIAATAKDAYEEAINDLPK